MAGDGGGENATLESTPTWAVATVCFVLIAISIIIEHALHLLAKYLGRKRRKSLLHALNKIKSDLMLLGFISLLLTVLERPIARICVPKGVGESFLPCPGHLASVEEEESKCLEQMKRWEHWEAETRTLEYQFSNDPRRFQFIHQTSFGRRHLKYWSEHRLLRLPVSFLRQFFGSVYKVDYFTLRHGFITAHFSEETNFDFQKYLKRALEKDFEVVVGMRLWIWFFSVLFIFFNANKFHSYAWLPFIPLVMLLVVGTKLQGIITKMCLDSNDKSHVIRGTLLVEPSDHFFWFCRPILLLHLMHFISFQNSFQLAFFTWSWYKFGLRSCFHHENEDIVIKLAMGITIPILCGYVTLPLYALVTQMGTSMRKSVFPEEVVGGLKRWRAKARRNLAKGKRNLGHRLLDASVESSPSFSTLETSRPLDVDYTSDDGVEPIVRLDEDNEDERRPEQQQRKLRSFEGFDLSRV
ncbi:mlo protein homolog 1 [Phtheirospermum japonicum]|uniref:MLO-like protein n=1 Tax=Phtheirospermum japonicum TaxID=374723 RepID=A0A830CD51_9LAMI|nr:mlo protein homolog 1 [Phtheirospermum japonicum]